MMKYKHIANGRSVPGKMQKNDSDISIDGKSNRR